MTVQEKPALDPGTVEAWKHKKRGTVYRVLHNNAPMQEEQTEGRRLDDEPMVVYQDIASGAVYVRPVVEFYDGRFEQIAAATLPKSTLASLPLEWRKEAVRHSNAAAEDDCDVGGDEWWLHRESSRIYKKCANALDDALLASPAPDPGTVEACAKVAEKRALRYSSQGGQQRADESHEIAKDIRALASPAPEETLGYTQYTRYRP